MVEGHGVHRVAASARRHLVGKRFTATSPNGRFAHGAEVIDAKELDAAFYAARLAGGIDIYVPVLPGGGPTKLKKEDVGAEVAYLESEAFKMHVLHGWRKSKSQTQELI
mgnify:CR=1 FL=1